MIDKIQFENYRAFRTPQNLELKPITVIFGKNNSGKTALLKLPALIESSLEGDTDEVFSSVTNNGVIICTELRDIVYGRANRAVRFVISDSEKAYSLDYSFFVDTTKQVQTHIENCNLLKDKNTIFSYTNTTNDNTDNIFNGIVPKDEFRKDFFRNLDFQTDYISSIRAIPALDFRLNPSLSDLSENDGSNCYQYIIRESLKTNSEALATVSDWYEKNFDGWRISIDKSQSPIYHVEMKNGSISNNILDTGFGIIQSLPIIIRTARKCIKPTLVILEEPESHLHPAAHASLGELIAKSALEDKNKRYLIETHSQNFLLRLRRMIAEKKISKDDVAFYYVSFEKSDLSSKLNKIIINDNGMIDKSTPWPKGIFEESLQEVIGIRDAQN